VYKLLIKPFLSPLRKVSAPSSITLSISTVSTDAREWLQSHLGWYACFDERRGYGTVHDVCYNEFHQLIN
jgi:hypothetical protein